MIRDRKGLPGSWYKGPDDFTTKPPFDPDRRDKIGLDQPIYGKEKLNRKTKSTGFKKPKEGVDYPHITGLYDDGTSDLSRRRASKGWKFDGAESSLEKFKKEKKQKEIIKNTRFLKEQEKNLGKFVKADDNLSIDLGNEFIPAGPHYNAAPGFRFSNAELWGTDYTDPNKKDIRNALDIKYTRGKDGACHDGAKNYGVRGTVNEDQARRIGIWMDNTESFYHSTMAPISKNMQRKVKKGTYDPVLHTKAYYNAVNYALKDPNLQELEGLNKTNVSPATRKAVAEYLTKRHPKGE